MKLKKILSWMLVIFVLVVMSGSIAKLTDQLPNLNDFWKLIKDGKNGWLSYTLAFFFANFLRSQRWRFVLGNHIKLSAFQAWINFQWLFMVKSISPFRSGEIVRAFWLKTRGGSGSYGVGVFLVERISDLIVLFWGGLLVSYYFLNERWSTGYFILIICLILSATIFVFFAESFNFIFTFSINLVKKHSISEKLLCHRIENFQHSVINELTPWRRIMILFLTCCIWCVLAYGMGVALLSLNLLYHGTESIGLLVATNFTGFISPLPANLGSYQLAGSGILLQYGVVLRDAVTFTVVLQIVMLLQVTIVGLLSLLFVNLSNKTRIMNIKFDLSE